MSKKLDSILSQVPPATAKVSNQSFSNYTPKADNSEKNVRITAVIPLSLKKQIRSYLEQNPFDTERTIILKSLKAFGLDVEDNLLVDKRRMRKESSE